MDEFIDRQAAIDSLLGWADQLTETYGKNDEYVRCLESAAYNIEQIPAADVRPVVLCRDCVYWQKPQVKLNGGTYRDYEQGEYKNGSLFGGVTTDVGINIGSFCAKYNTEHQNRIPQFMGENDFCSKGYKLREES